MIEFKKQWAQNDHGRRRRHTGWADTISSNETTRGPGRSRPFRIVLSPFVACPHPSPLLPASLPEWPDRGEVVQCDDNQKAHKFLQIGSAHGRCKAGDEQNGLMKARAESSKRLEWDFETIRIVTDDLWVMRANLTFGKARISNFRTMRASDRYHQCGAKPIAVVSLVRPYEKPNSIKFCCWLKSNAASRKTCKGKNTKLRE